MPKQINAMIEMMIKKDNNAPFYKIPTLRFHSRIKAAPRTAHSIIVE